MRDVLKKLAAISYGTMLALALLAGISATPRPALAGVCTCPDGKTTVNTCETDDMCGAADCGTSGKATCKGGTGAGTGTAGKPTAGALENPLAGVCGGAEGQKCVQLVIGNVIKAALGIVGSIALLMMTYGGFLWLTSMGNSNQVEKGKNTLIWSTLGLALIFGAYALTSYIISIVNK